MERSPLQEVEETQYNQTIMTEKREQSDKEWKDKENVQQNNFTPRSKKATLREFDPLYVSSPLDRICMQVKEDEIDDTRLLQEFSEGHNENALNATRLVGDTTNKNTRESNEYNSECTDISKDIPFIPQENESSQYSLTSDKSDSGNGSATSSNQCDTFNKETHNAVDKTTVITDPVLAFTSLSEVNNTDDGGNQTELITANVTVTTVECAGCDNSYESEPVSASHIGLEAVHQEKTVICDTTILVDVIDEQKSVDQENPTVCETTILADGIGEQENIDLETSAVTEGNDSTNIDNKQETIDAEELTASKEDTSNVDDEKRLVSIEASLAVEEKKTANDTQERIEESVEIHKNQPDEPKSLDQETQVESPNTTQNLENSVLVAASSILDVIIASIPDIIISEKEAMADDVSDIARQERELSDLKLQLNQCQQVIATLELQLRQKEEIVIKAEAEAQRRELQFKQEIKQLKEKLDAKSEVKEGDDYQKLKECVQKMKAQEEKLLDQLNKLSSDEDGFKQIMDEYEKTISQEISETEKLRREHETVKRHFATLELAFSDVHQKYERSKTIIEGYKSNEETLRHNLLTANETIKKNDEKYESLKAHAKAQIEKSNKDLNFARDRAQAELHKLTAIIKRLEIKNASLVNALDQKTKECSALAALCDEVTGHVE